MYPPGIFPTHPLRTLGFAARGNIRGEFVSCKYIGLTYWRCFVSSCFHAYYPRFSCTWCQFTWTSLCLTISQMQKYCISILLNLCIFIVPFTIPVAVALSQCIGVGGCGCPSFRQVSLTILDSFAFRNIAPIYASAADAATFFSIWHKVNIAPLIGGSPQKFSSNILISTLHTFILGSQNSEISPTKKSHISLITQNSPYNPMASIRSLFEMCLPLYMGIPYLFITRAWGGILLLCPRWLIYL